MPDLPTDHEDDSEQEVPAEETEEVEESEDGQDKADKPLGPAGEKALAAEKDKRRTEAAKRRDAEKRASDLEAELARLRKAADKPKNEPKDDAPDPDEVRREAEQAALAKANDRIIRAEIRAAAAGKLATPADALNFLDLTKFEVDTDGNVDADEVADAIDDLLKTKPYLAVAQSDGKRFKGSGDGGAKPNKPARPKSLTEAVTKALSPS